MTSNDDPTMEDDLRNAERRSDAVTAEKIDMALLTRRAFDSRTARTFCRLSGIHDQLAEHVLGRGADEVRRTTTMLAPADRRTKPS